MKRLLSATGLPYARRNKWLHIVAVFVMLAAFSVGAVRPTFADDPERGPGGEYLNETTGEVVLSAEEQKVLDAKNELLDKYRDVKAGNMSLATHKEHVDSFLDSLGITDKTRFQAATDHMDECFAQMETCQDSTENWGTPTLEGAAAPDAASRERNILWTTVYVPQPNNFYCGAATVFSMAYHRGKFTSFWGDSINQYNIAARCTGSQSGCGDTRGKYTQTDYYRETPWRVRDLLYPWYEVYYYPLKHGINRWLLGYDQGGDYVATGIPSPGTYTDFKDRVTMDVDYSWAVAANVAENVTDPDTGGSTGQLVGHPGWPGSGTQPRPLWHIVAVRGYSDWGNYLHYVDSAYQGVNLGTGFTLTQGNQRLETTKMWKMVKMRGYLW